MTSFKECPCSILKKFISLQRNHLLKPHCPTCSYLLPLYRKLPQSVPVGPHDPLFIMCSWELSWWDSHLSVTSLCDLIPSGPVVLTLFKILLVMISKQKFTWQLYWKYPFPAYQHICRFACPKIVHKYMYSLYWDLKSYEWEEALDRNHGVTNYQYKPTTTDKPCWKE